MIRLEQNRNDAGTLDNPAGRLVRVEIRHAVPQAMLGWMAFLQVFLALLIQRFRPRQHGDLDSTRAEVLEIPGVSGLPDSGQIRLAIRRLRRRGREVRFSVRRSRNPGGWVMQPLCGQWHARRWKDYESHNRSRTRHVGLPFDTLYTLLRYTSKSQSEPWTSLNPGGRGARRCAPRPTSSRHRMYSQARRYLRPAARD